MDLLKHVRRALTVEEAHAAAEARGAQCSICPLYGKRQGPVMGEVRPNAPLLTVGEAPGGHEVDSGRPFVGPSGEEYNIALRDGGLKREEVSTVNVLGCRPPPPDDLSTYLLRLNKDWKKACKKADKDGLPHPPPPANPIECCRPRLERDIAESNSPVILAIGGKALQAMAAHFRVPYGSGADGENKVSLATIKYQHGSPKLMPDGRILCSSLHPAFAMREKHYKRVVRNDIARAAKIVSRGNKIDWSVPAAKLFPSIDEIEETCARFVASGVPITFDIETNSIDIFTCHVRCVGLGAKLPGDAEETVIVVPFHWKDGRQYWASDSDRVRAENAVRKVLDDCELIAHNATFDISVCRHVGLMSVDKELKPSVMKQVFDTMLAHHNSDSNDLPHDLGFVTRQYTEAPLWKKDVDHKTSEAVESDRDLYLYNSVDICTTSRIAPFIKARLAQCGTQPQHDFDTALAPVAREMGLLGVPIDEEYRGHLSKEFNQVALDLRDEFKTMSGKDINPRSSPQIGTWLYEDLGYSPPLNPQGYEWEDGDDWSTSTPALLKLLDLGVDPRTASSIDSLLKFRACETIRGRYIDRLPVRYVDDPILALAGRTPAVKLSDGTELFPERAALSQINTGFKLHVVPSGRWSSQPNVQAIPARAFVARNVDPDQRDMLTGQMKINPKNGKPYPERTPTNLRRMFVAPPGHVLIGGDYSQLELRLYAVIAQDRLVRKAFDDGLDPHTLNAATLFSPSPDKIMETYHMLCAKKKQGDAAEAELKYLRTVAKRFVFLEAYGGEVEKLFSTMASERDKATGERVFQNLTERRVKEWHERWHTAHPETAAWHARVHRELRARGYSQAPLLDKRKRFFPGGPTKKNAPVNHELQSAAASIVGRAVLAIAEEIPFRSWSRWTGLCLQIHDQIIAIVPESRADQAKEIFERCMPYEIDGLPIFAEVSASRNWAKQL